ncbi:MAG TPA: hypothetical protein VHE12_06580 [bacterium]|nr:hypothetical protein [bacterium]
MIVCPKCNQTSANDKFCTNCWTDLAAKPRKRKPEGDRLGEKQKSVLILGGLAILAFLMLSMLLELMKNNARERSEPVPVATVTVP